MKPLHDAPATYRGPTLTSVSCRVNGHYLLKEDTIWAFPLQKQMGQNWMTIITQVSPPQCFSMSV